MKSKKKLFRLLSWLLIVLLVSGQMQTPDVTALASVATGSNTDHSYSIIVDEVEHGVIAANKEIAAEGDKVTLSAIPDAGYELYAWSVIASDSNAVHVKNDTFTMPASDVNVSAVFTAVLDENREELSALCEYVDNLDAEDYTENSYEVLMEYRSLITSDIIDAATDSQIETILAKLEAFINDLEPVDTLTSNYSLIQELDTGTYYVELTELPTKAGRNPGYNKINIAPRAVLTVNQGKYFLSLRVYGYTHWNVLKYLSQEGYASVDSLAAGTDWTAYDGSEMVGYQTLADKSGDSSTNTYWSTISKVRTKKVDSDKDMAVVAIQLTNLEDAFALGGYATTTYGEQQFDYLAVQGYKLNLDTVTSGTNLMYYAAGMEVENSDFALDFARTIPIVSNIAYDNTDTLTGLFSENFVEAVSCVPNNGIIDATFTVKEDTKENIQSIHVLQSANLDSVFETRASKTQFQGYLLGTYGNTYGENIYDASTKQFTITFNNNDKVNSLITGVDVKIVTDEHPDGYRAVLYLSEDGMTLQTIEDEETGASYTSYAKYITNKELVVKSGEDANAVAVSDVKNVADGDKWRAYSFYLQDEDGSSYMPQKGGVARVPVPKEWDLDNTYIGIYTQSGKSVTTDNYEKFSTYAKIVDTETERYLEYTTQLNKWVADGSVVMCEVLNEADLNTLSEDGYYAVTAKFVKAGAEGVLSMADGCLERETIVEVENGKKTVYLNFHPLLMAEEYCYLGAIWNKEISDCEYYDYEVDEDGDLIDNAGFDAITEFPCIKSVKITLSDDTIQDNSYVMKVIPPAMAGGCTYAEAMNSPIDVDLKFYNVEKITDESTVQIPTYQKSVLRRSIEKAKLYNEASYSEETWAALQTALSESETYYNTLAGTDAGTDQTVSNEIKAKSDAIENEIKNLAENSKLAEARANLKAAIDEASAIELGNKTVSAFNELQAVINEAQAAYERSNVSIDELNAQITALSDAVSTFNKSASASTLVPTQLEDGNYKVYVDMKKVDQVTDSMSNNAIDHWMNLEVKDGVYTASLDFTGLTISGQFGYLKSLKYYDAGYEFNGYGEPQGTLKDVTVISTQKNADGSDVVDSYNKAEGYLYPDVVSFPLVDGGTKEFVPLQVFVPIMEAIAEGTGTQNVLMQIDWTSLRLASDNTQDVFEFDTDGIYTLTSGIYETESDDTSAYVVYLEKSRLLVKDNAVQVYLDFQKNGENFIKGVSVLDETGVSVPVTTYYYKESGEIVRAVFTLPANVELTEIQLMANDDTFAAAGRLYLALRSAQIQSVDKTALNGYITTAEGKLEDGNTYTETSVQTLNVALEAAKSVNDDPVAIGSEISSVGVILRDAINGLVKVEPVDKTALQKAYDDASAITNDLNYNGWDALQSVLVEAKAVLDNDDATQDDVDTYVSAIQIAVNNLSAASIDKTALSNQIAKAEAIDVSAYSAASVVVLNSAIASAKAVLADEDATQEEIEQQILLLLEASEALIEKENANTVYPGTYEITGRMWHASMDQASMGNAALKNPMQVLVDVDDTTGDASVTLRMEYVPLTTSGFTGYLAALSYFPNWTGGTSGYQMPTTETPVAATVESYYENIYDSYNDPDFGTDANVKGKLYPHYMTIPVVLGDEEIWVQVYVPVMESITAGSGRQYAKLQLDWSTLEQTDGIGDTDETVLAQKTLLEAEIGKAEAIDLSGATAEEKEMLTNAITSAKEVLASSNVSAEAVNATRQMLIAAMAVFTGDSGAVDKSELATTIKLADSYLNSTDLTYTDATRSLLQTVRDNAAEIYADESATQTQVNLSVEAILEAIDRLVTYGTDKTELRNALTAVLVCMNETDLYTSGSMDILRALYTTAKAVYESDASQEEVDAQVRLLKHAVANMTPVNQAVVDKTGLYTMLLCAIDHSAKDSIYTDATITTLKTVITTAKAVYLNTASTQAEVDVQLDALLNAIIGLVIDPDVYYSSDDDDDDSDLDYEDLDDGEYYLTGRMFKTDKSTKSMADAAIDHTVMLTVNDGDYYITLEFDGITISGKYGYLGSLKYFTNSYDVNSYGAPTGTTKSVSVKSYQKEDGKTVKDDYGSKYPAEVKFKLIDRALDDGWVPLQVYVPIMEAISKGTGTQPVWLKLYWNTIEEDPDNVDDATVTTTSATTTTTTTTPTTSLLTTPSTLTATGTGLTGNSLPGTAASGLAAMAPVEGNRYTGSGSAAVSGNSSGAAAGSGFTVSSGLKSNSALEQMLSDAGNVDSVISGFDSQAVNSLAELPQLTESDKVLQSIETAVPAATVISGNGNAAKEKQNSASTFPLVSSIVIILAGLFYQLKGKKFFGV